MMSNSSDLNNAQVVREHVRAGYAEVARTGGMGSGSGCCSSQSCCGSVATGADQLAKRVGYSEAELATLPEGANMGLSCGNPTALASLKPGEVVVDLGSGGGFDCFLAGPRVGAGGRGLRVGNNPGDPGQGPAHLPAFPHRGEPPKPEVSLGGI